jgi:hypothetical protein
MHVEQFIYRYATTPLVELTKCFTDYFNVWTYNFNKELRVLPDDDR